jgi:hypothetical protein
MKSKKISYMPYVAGFFLLALLVLGGPFLFPSSRIAYGHTFTTSESAQFISLIEQIRAEMGLAIKNLENNNVTLAQSHAERAANILSNSTLDEIWERNTRIADTLESMLPQLRDNVTLLTVASQQQIPQDRLQSINQTIQSLNDTLSEAVTVRVESEQRNNATMWAMVLANLTDTILRNYGNATGAAFDLTDMTNMTDVAGMEGQGARASPEGINNNTMQGITTASNVTTNTIIVEAAYQTAQYLANNTLLRIFNETLKPLTIANTGANDTSAINNATSDVDELEMSLLQLRDYVNSKASPNEVMKIAHLKIHPMLMQLYGLTQENEEEG